MGQGYRKEGKLITLSNVTILKNKQRGLDKMSVSSLPVLIAERPVMTGSW